jgi:glycosyltransferase involved in cell wall biosynthesis/O-antigen/teichoic acid export membrane protein
VVAEPQQAAPKRPVRVLIVAARFLPDLGGTETHIYEVTRRIARDGDFQLTVLTTDRSGELPAEEELEGFTVMRCRSYPRHRDYYFAPSLYRQIVSGHYDLIHCQGVHTAVPVSAMLGARRSRTPYVVTLHTGGHSSVLRHSLRTIQWRILGPLLRRATMIVAVSRFEQELFAKTCHIDPRRFAIVQNGGDLPVGSAHTSPVPDLIVSSGRLERYKGHHRVIEAIPIVQRSVPDAKLKILGAGPYEGDLRTLIKRLHMDESITIDYIPPGDRARVAESLSEAAVLAALSEYEAHPVAVMEALALGIPAVGLDAAGLGDLVEDDLITGVPNDAPAEAVAQVLVSALARGRSAVSARLPTWDAAAADVARIYMETVTTSPKAQRHSGAVVPIDLHLRRQPSQAQLRTSPGTRASPGTCVLMTAQRDDHQRGPSSPPPSPRWIAGIRTVASRQLSSPLSRGGLALLLNTGLTAILGFGYWIIAARLFSTYAVGIAGALVSATTLFSGLGQLNLSGMLMRFLPKAGGKSRRLVLFTYTYAAVASALLAAMCLMGVRYFASPTSPLRLDTIQSAAFVLAAAATAIFTIQDSVLIAVRRPIWIPIENGSFGIAKVAALFVFAPLGTAFAVFGAWMIPLTLTIPVISAVLFFRFLPRTSIAQRTAVLGRRARSKMIRFAIGDATGGLFTQAWTYLPPVIITVSLGASVNALYYISFLISSTIDQVAANYASPLTVEAAHAPDEIATLIRSALRHIYAITLPVIFLLIIACPWLLGAFGHKYAGAAPAMRLLLIASLPKAISTVYYAYCRVDRSTHKSAIMQAYVCIATLSGIIIVARPFKLIGICLVIVVVQTSTGAASWLALKKALRAFENGNYQQGRHRRRRDRQMIISVRPATNGK